VITPRAVAQRTNLMVEMASYMMSVTLSACQRHRIVPRIPAVRILRAISGRELILASAKIDSTRTHQNSSISEELSGAKFEDKKNSSEFFDGGNV
jgi:hypothetical protein